MQKDFRIPTLVKAPALPHINIWGFIYRKLKIMMALNLYLWVLKWLGSSQKRILESKRLADVIFISPPVPQRKKNS